MSVKDKLKAINEALSNIVKQFGKGAIMALEDVRAEPAAIFPS
jgi:hypothetical protein